jgi:hypothetical protein
MGTPARPFLTRTVRSQRDQANSVSQLRIAGSLVIKVRHRIHQPRPRVLRLRPSKAKLQIGRIRRRNSFANVKGIGRGQAAALRRLKRNDESVLRPSHIKRSTEWVAGFKNIAR